MNNMRSGNRKKHVRTSRWSLPAELIVGTFFISLLLALAFIASNLDIPAVITHNIAYTEYAEDVYGGDAAIVMPVSRPGEVPQVPHGTYYPVPNRIPPTYASLSQLDTFFNRYGDRIGIYYKNLETGFTYTFNPDMVFFGASLNKAQYALYIHIAAERGYIDMYAVHTFTSSDWWGGTGIIRFMPAGARLTTRELLRHAVVYSDNVAHRMLARYMERISFSYRDFVQEIGASPYLIRNIYSHNTSAADTAIWFYALHTYLESDSRYGHYLLYDLLNTAYYSHPYFTRGRVFGGSSPVNVRLMHTCYPMAQKYGWAVESFNVAGIVYAGSPFMLVIISDMDSGAHDLFKEISQLMQEFNGRYF